MLRRLHVSRIVIPIVLGVPIALSVPALNAFAGTTSCSSVAACIFGKNSSSGPGVQGTSSSGFGLSGNSKSNHGVNGTSASSFGVVGITTENASNGQVARAGVYGEDGSTNKGIYNAGVAGRSAYGIGTLGETTTGVAVEGLAVGSGKYVSKPKYNSIGVYGDADAGPGVYGFAHGTTSDSYGTGAEIDQNNRPAFFGQSDGDGGGGIVLRTPADGFILIGTTFENGDVASIDGFGNEVLAGSLTQNGSPLVRTHRFAGGDVTTFGERSSTPTIEDMGEATLVSGQTYVAIDHAFGGAIDPHAKYLVFLTPEGDSHGLYVTAQSTRGFAVHENGGAHSSLAFNFRIVAKPFDTAASRLPAMAARSHVARAAVTRPAFAK